MNWPLPIKGYNEGVNVENTPPDTTNIMNNVYPIDTLSNRIRLGKRPGTRKVFDEQIASSPGAVVELGSVTIVDYIGDES